MPDEFLTDFISGRPVANVGAEANRQMVERFLVESKGYRRSDISVDFEVTIPVAGSPYRARVDLLVSIPCEKHSGAPVAVMAVKCAAGSIGSREREILAAARVVNEHYQIPLAVATDGRTAIVLDTVSGKKWKEGLDRIPSRQEAEALLNTLTLERLPEKRLEGERLIFRSYDSQNVNRV